MNETALEILAEAYKKKDWEKVRRAYQMIGGKELAPHSIVIDYDWRLSDLKQTPSEKPH
jgi:hypothetical protein